MNKFVMIALLVSLITAQGQSITPCTCDQLLSENDCKQSANDCAWNTEESACKNNTTPIESIKIPQYCDDFKRTQCSEEIGCAWVNEKCTFFTGCTPFNKTSDADCKNISNRCTTDETHCVEISACSYYRKKESCEKNSFGKYCYWDENETCLDADTCEKLPQTLMTDEDCRQQISTCTTTGSGCKTSETNCSDQKNEISCFWNYDKSQACYWTGSACVDKKCENAPLNFTTDEQCNSFTLDQTCTTKLGGGCITRTACSDVKVQAGCIKNNQGLSCFWNGQQCLDLNCNNAPIKFSTNQSCFGFLSTCITNGNGCVINTTCSSAIIKQACKKNALGEKCIWNQGFCKEKTCENAPASNNSHSLCTTYLSTCTVNAQGNGCINRTCSNAPKTIVSNQDCEDYLPNNNCITKDGGGCVSNTTCAAITTEIACVTDVNGNDCFWHSNGQCKNKTCSNAPITFTDDSNCFEYSNSCTLSSSGQGCTDRVCENIQKSEICTIDLNNQMCIYKGLCYKKECELAPLSFNTHADCNEYLQSCTLNSNGQGCVPIPLVCSAITNQNSCFLKIVINPNTGTVTYSSCGWNGQKCVDQGCTTLPTYYVTTADCNAALSNCVSANPVNGIVSGCMDLPTICAARKTQDNCEVNSASGTPRCIWNLTLSTPACVERSCDTASAIGTTDAVSIFTNYNCNNYLSTCIADNNATGCQAKTTTCSSLASTNCLSGAKTSGDCYWNGAWCVDKTCANISGYSHANCNGQFNTCTVKADASGCMPLAATCNYYTSQINCKVKSAGKNCVWIGTQCRSAVCNDATDSAAFDTDEECQTYPAVSGTCTVIYKVGASGCVSRLPNCTDYTSQTQCYRTLGASSDDCIWISSGLCLSKSAFVTGACSTFKGTQADCQLYRLGCTNVANAQASDTCIFDCTKKIGTSGSFSFSDCQAFDQTCSVNYDGSACVTRQYSCAGYVAASGADCVQTSYTDLCVWHNYACVSVTAANTDCAYVTGSDLTHADCQTYNVGCTNVRDGSTCQEYKVVCTDYVNIANACTRASADGLCVMNATPTCIKPVTAVTDCEFVTGTGLTDATCATYLTGCVALLDGTGCHEFAFQCASYTTANTCTTAYTGKCYYGFTAAGMVDQCFSISTDIECELVLSASIDHTGCQVYNSFCTVKLGQGCQKYQTFCSSYSIDAAHCVNNSAGVKCYWYNPLGGVGTCIQILTASTDCAKVTSGVSTFADCQAYNTGCSINRASNACVELKAACTSYSIADCAQTSANSLCIASSSTDTQCVAASTASTCEEVYLGTGNYSDTNCNKFKTGCTANSGYTGCTLRTCANYNFYYGVVNHQNCNAWLRTCTLNVEANGCITMPIKCNDAGQTVANCILYAEEGECVIFDSKCVKKTCDTVPNSISFDSDRECSDYLSSCTVARTGGCQARTACGSYKSSIQCKYNSSGSKCFWNPTVLTCVDLQCANVEQTTSYDSHSECYSIDSNLKCTVRASYDLAAPGCMARTVCHFYTIQDQCVINNTGGACEWNTNQDKPACADKTCSTAPIAAYTTHSACYGYLNTCTSAVIDNNGVHILSGCQTLAACNTYIMEDQCVVDASGTLCGWNGSTCANKSCVTAPATVDYQTDPQCRAYFTGCTVAATGYGCVTLGTCESYSYQGQCVTDITGALCYWNNISKTCYTRTCENAPSDVADPAGCNTYLANCTMDFVKCKTKICEDFPLTTHSQCSAAMSSCTSNGTNCVTIGTCAQALSSQACVIQSDGAQCQWIEANEFTVAHCEIKTCQTAPDDLVIEAQCVAYLPGCTTKLNGGCILKSSCGSANVQSACTKDVNGKNCQWDLTNNSCRDEECKDLKGSSHADCQKYNSNCTVGVNGYCEKITTCANTKVQGACIKGTDGPCLWISGYINSDGTTGACFSYTSCQSLKWTSHAQCNLISNNCTTNGTNCVGITLCSETNTNGGCVNGIDGECIQLVDALGSNNPFKCKVFTSCADAYYLTHDECQTASSKCTTNGLTGCVALDACSTYNQAGCYINGVVSTSGASTGVCSWDNTANACRDQICADLFGTNHAACSAQLSTCTSNGTQCITKATCSTYAQTGCFQGIGVGTDGICFWDSTATSPTCRTMVCGDIANGIDTTVCSASLPGCISDGIKCITKAACQTYTTRTSCNSGGTENGICAFSPSTFSGAAAGSGTCKLMTACGDAQSDYIACLTVKDRCAWTTAKITSTNSIASKCTNHTCATYQSTFGVCGNFLNWEKTDYQICTIQNSQCTATDASTLKSADCYFASGYTYTWSTQSSKCDVCQTKSVVNQNDTNTTNSTNNTNTTAYTNNTNNTNTTSVYGYFLQVYIALVLVY